MYSQQMPLSAPNFLFTPIKQTDGPYRSKFPPKKSASSPHLHPFTNRYSAYNYMDIDSEEEQEDGAIYTLSHASDRPTSVSLRARMFARRPSAASLRPRQDAKCISTTPGELGAGETETEPDEPVSMKCFVLTRLFRVFRVFPYAFFRANDRSSPSTFPQHASYLLLPLLSPQTPSNSA